MTYTPGIPEYGVVRDAEEDRFFHDLFGSTHVMVILRGLDPAAAVARATDAWDHGLRAIEVTVASEGHLETLGEVVTAGHARGQLVGAGSVYRLSQVERVVRAGADFAVAPGMHADVSRACRTAALPYLPGVATPGEIALAETLGHTWLKVFPASVLGPRWISAMRGPFPWPKWVATGGITLGNAADFLRAGATAVGMGAAVEEWDAAQVLLGSQSRATPATSEGDAR